METEHKAARLRLLAGELVYAGYAECVRAKRKPLTVAVASLGVNILVFVVIVSFHHSL